ncbi:TetR/AcrR family transcriptional regulator [soil metagenome]
MAKSGRKQREREMVRQEILDAAREMFVTDGYENVSIRKIADRIDISTFLIYTHFQDKSELLHAVCDSIFEGLSVSILDSWRTAADPLELLRNGLAAYIQFALEDPHFYEAVFITPIEKYNGISKPDFDKTMGKRAFELLLASVNDCMEAGLIRKGDVFLTGHTLWAAIHGTASLLITHKGFPGLDRKTLIPSVIDTMIEGLKN